jgi:transposase-like protein
MKQPKSFQDLMQNFTTNKACIKLLEQERWPGGNPVCPHCGHDRSYKLKGDGQYKCASNKCYKKYSILKGTIFADSNIPLPTWFAAIFLATSHKRGISSHQLARDLHLTQKTAWFMLSRIRDMVRIKVEQKSTSLAVVQVDESFMGGKNKNRHAHKKVLDSQGRSAKDKTPVFGILKGGNVILRVVPDTKAKTLQPIIRKLVMEGSIIVSDEWLGYSNLSKDGKYNHLVIKHKEHEYTRGAFHTNSMENFWSIFKRAIFGTYYKVSRKHMHRYCDEMGYKYNTRRMKDFERFILTLRNSGGGKLPYKELVANWKAA